VMRSAPRSFSLSSSCIPATWRFELLEHDGKDLP
jgi:hypothetical protein